MSISSFINSKSNIKEYDNAVENGEPLSKIPKIDILQAINFIVTAWNNVSISTIQNSWKRVDILPNEIEINDINIGSTTNEDLNEEFDESVKFFPIDQNETRMEWGEYIDIDSELNANENPTLEEIVNIVKEVEEPEEEETKSSIMPISHKTALQDCYNILMKIRI